MTFEMPIEAKNPNWNKLVLGNLPGTFTESEFQLV